MKEIRTLIVQMAEENSSCGYCRLRGGMKSLNHQVARSTIAKVLKEHGIAPVPGRPSSWRTFIRSHAAVIAGAPTMSEGRVEVRDRLGGLLNYYDREAA
jgi:hypothetical protein